MFTRIVAIITLSAFLLTLYACTTLVTRYKDDPIEGREQIERVVMPDGSTIRFPGDNARYDIANRTINGFDEEGTWREIPIDDISYLAVRKIDNAGTIAATLGLAVVLLGAIVVTIAVTKESCPFIYSFDGEKYEFDAEPLGGAICRGMKRFDYSRLDHLKPVDGEYRLLVRNEVEETQYIDELSLFVIDHDPAFEIVADTACHFYSVPSRALPTAISDEHGLDLMPFIKESDGVYWTDKMPTDTVWNEMTMRHEITCTFPRPPDADSAWMVANVGTTLWGSNMIKEMLQLRGQQIDQWYAEVAQGGEAKTRMNQFIKREELYVLAINVLVGETWEERGYFHGAGPFMVEDRVLPIDLSGVEGDSVVMKFRPPLGFWTIDYLAMAYDVTPFKISNELNPLAASDSTGWDIAPILENTDDNYYTMPEVGDWFKISYAAPPPVEGKKRTIFLKSSGYYEIHLDKTAPTQVDVLTANAMMPGEVMKFSVRQYQKWLHATQAAKER
jgi:hypothetical protein